MRWILKEVISSQYNRENSKRCAQTSVLFVIEDVTRNSFALFQIDRIHKHSVSLRCNQRKCSHRLSLKHFLDTEQRGKYRMHRFKRQKTKRN